MATVNVMPSSSIKPNLRPRSAKKIARPVIQRFNNYRTYLRAMFDYRKARDGGDAMSFRLLAAKAGFKSVGSLHMVFDGQRNLGSDRIAPLAEALGLRPPEARFLRDMVEMNQAADPAKQVRQLKKLARRPEFRERFHVDEDVLECLGSWYTLAIHEMIGLPDFQSEPAWIAARLGPSVTTRQIEAALQLLLRLKLAEQRPDGKMRRTAHEIETPDELHNEIVRNYHDAILDTARWALANVPAAQRNFGAVTGRLTAAKYAELRQMLHRQSREIAEFFTASAEASADHIVQVNLQTYPLTVPSKESKS